MKGRVAVRASVVVSLRERGRLDTGMRECVREGRTVKMVGGTRAVLSDS